MKAYFRALVRLAGIAALGAMAPAWATTSYCVGTQAQLQNALDQAEVDGDDSLVRVRSGSYTLSANVTYQPDLEYLVAPGKLTVRGGYNSDCSAYSLTQGATTFNGGGSRRFQAFTETGEVSLAGMTFQSAFVELNGDVENGSLVDECSVLVINFALRRIRVDQGSMDIDAPCQDVIIENVLLTNGLPKPGATARSADTGLWVRLFSFGAGGASLTVTNSTVSNGRTTVVSCCGDGVPSAVFVNSIFDRPAGADIFSQAATLVRHSRYDSISYTSPGIAVPGFSNNTSASPELNASFVPQSGSPMIDSGTSNVPGGLSDTDLAGNDRVIGPEVDRGALESPPPVVVVGLTVTNTAASGPGSLLAAVTAANANASRSTIKFDIPGGCGQRINLSAALQIRAPVTIDGWSQPNSVQNTAETGFNAIPCVILDGNGVVTVGIETLPDIGSGQMTVRGLAFEGFSTAILLPYGDGHAIYGNQFGGRIGNAGAILTGNGNPILLGGGRTIVGGFPDSFRNLIGDSTGSGVLATGATADNNAIINNLIGLDKDGFTALPNLDGIRINTSGNTVIGNRIGGNNRDGVVIRSDSGEDNLVQGNWIGGNSGIISLVASNIRAGVLLEEGAHDNQIGPDNFMFRNGDSAVRLLATSMGHNRITGNRIGLNDSPGIDLGANGVTANDNDPTLCTVGTGCAANRGQNFPVLGEAVRASVFPVGKPVRIEGTLRSVSGGPYGIEFFGSDTCYSAGHGQGGRFLGSTDVTIQGGFCTNGNCTVSFSTFVSEVDMDIGDVVTATATSPAGDTSEFSACVPYEAPQVAGPLLVDSFE